MIIKLQRAYSYILHLTLIWFTDVIFFLHVLLFIAVVTLPLCNSGQQVFFVRSGFRSSTHSENMQSIRIVSQLVMMF